MALRKPVVVLADGTYSELPTTDSLAGVQAGSAGFTIPALNVSVTVTVTWPTAFPDAAYTPVVSVMATGLTAGAFEVLITAKTASALTVLVRTVLAVVGATAGTITAVAVR